MTHPSTAREALIVEAIGDVAELVKAVEMSATRLEATCQAFQQARIGLHDELAGFESRLATLTENAKTVTNRYLAARVVEATRRSIDEQSRAMSDAARTAFKAELGPMLQRLQTFLQPLLEQRGRAWRRYVTHAAAAGAGSVATWAIAAHRWLT
jgi:hypothetical protein